MSTELVTTLAAHRFLEGLDRSDLEDLATCGAPRHVGAGAHLANEGEPAEQFHLIVAGRVGVEVHVPRRGPVVVSTLHAGDVFGWSWLYPPNQWDFDAVALDDVDEVVLEVEALRDVLAERPALAAELTHRLGAVLASRLHSARTQLVDLYGRVR